MIRKDREITDIKEKLSIIDENNVMALAMVDGDKPYVIPMNYGYTYENDKLCLYMHCAKKGKKLEVLEKNNNVSIEIDYKHQIEEGKLPCQYSFYFASIVGHGKAYIIESDDEKIEAMKVIMKHIAKKDFEFNARLLSIVEMIKVEIDEFTGKKREMKVK